MIGATMMCSRSRHFAARKRDTVSAPPSISTRRRPRSASAARIAAGAICPSVLGMPTISMSAGNGGLCARAGHDQSAHAIIGEELCAGRQPPAGIDDDPRRLRAGHAPHRELRIVGQRRADPDHHRIDQRPQPMQMRKPGRSVDVVGMSGFGGNPAVQRLADLRDRDEFIDPAVPQRAEQSLPRGRQREGQRPKRLRNGGPEIHILTVFGRSDAAGLSKVRPAALARNTRRRNFNLP